MNLIANFLRNLKLYTKKYWHFFFLNCSLSAIYCLLKKAPCSSTLFVTVIHIFYEYPGTNYCIIIHFFGHNTFLYKSLPTSSLYILFITAPLPKAIYINLSHISHIAKTYIIYYHITIVLNCYKYDTILWT